MKNNIRLLTCLAAVALAPLVSAQVNFTITGTAAANTVNLSGGATHATSTYGYTGGSSYTFTYSLAANFNSSNSEFYAIGTNGHGQSILDYGYYSLVQQSSNSDANMWNSISGSGVNGTYVLPSSGGSYAIDRTPYLNTSTDPKNTVLAAYSGDENPLNLGLKTLANQSVWGIQAEFVASAATFSMSNAWTAPSTFYTGAVGTYTGANLGFVQLWIDNRAGTNIGEYVPFTVTNAVVSVSAIPEPSTYATLLGAAALGFVAWRRRRLA